MLNKFLSKFKTNESIYTHTCMGGGKYNIPDEKIDSLYKILEKTEKYHLIEKHLESTSILVFDFDFILNSDMRIIKDINIYKIIQIINMILDVFCINPNKTVYIMQRDNPYKKDNIFKDGIHLIYPFISLDYNFIFLLRYYLLDKLKWLETISSNIIDDIIDKSVIKSNGWFLYGATKPNISEYKIIRIYDNNLYKVEQTLTKYELLNLLSIRKNIELTQLKITPDDIIDGLNEYENNEIEFDEIKDTITNIKDKSKIKYILMHILNKSRADNYNDWIKIGFCLFNISKNNLDLWIEFSRLSSKYKIGECEKIWNKMKTPLKSLKLGTLYYFAKKDCPEKVQDLQILDTLNDIKHEFPNNNFEINKICRDRNYIYIDILDLFCPIFGNTHIKSSNYLEIIPERGIIMKCKCEECIGKIFPSDKDIIITNNQIKNIFNVTINNFYSNTDSDEIKVEVINVTNDINLNELLTDTLNSTNGKTYDLANILYYLFQDTFRYDCINKNWYYFNSKWIKCNNKLRTKISNDIVNYYKKMSKLIKIDCSGYKFKIKKIDNLIGDLKTTAFKNNIIKEAEEIFTDNHDNIINKLDTNMYLLGFENGVYDIKNKCFRQIKPDDYVSMTVRYNYIDKNSDKYDKTIEEKLLDFLEQIQPNESQRDYLLTYLSTCIIGINLLQHFVVFLGSGRNGKGKITELIDLTFGDYYSSFNTKLLTRPRLDASAPDPTMLDLIKKRIIIGSEIDKKDKLNTGYVKLLTGRDKIKTRYNHGNDMLEYQVNFKIILLCNRVPEPDEDDEAYRKRLKCIGFPTKFVDDPINPNEKKINHNLELDDFKQYFILLLIKYLDKYESHGLPKNDNIEQLTETISTNNNKGLEFMIEKTEHDENTSLHTQTLYEKFKDWFYTNYPDEKVPSIKIFLQNIRLKYETNDNITINKKKSTGIKNIKFKSFEI